MRSYVPLEGKRILDVGCGIGTFVRRLRDFSPEVYGIDIDFERVREGTAENPNLMLSVGEYLPFKDDNFDVVLLHEVIEHVDDDVRTMQEVCRVLRPGGRAVIFCPNRLYPFETHGIFVGKRYVFGNIPLVNYLPGLLRKKLVPHARAYLWSDIRRLWRNLPMRLIAHTLVFPGFDNVVTRRRVVGSMLRSLTYPLERTPLRNFGLSHFVVLEKVLPRS